MNKPIKHSIKHAFNKAANSYDHHCDLQQSVGLALLQQLKKIDSCFSSIIDLGCGTGKLTRTLALQCQYDDFYALDFADQFIQKARAQLHDLPITFIESDFNEMHLGKPLDLVFSNMSLQWSQDIKKTLQTIRTSIKKNGLLAFSIPLKHSLHELQPYCALNKFIDQNELLVWLSEHHYEILHTSSEDIILQFPTLITAIQSIKQVGANYATRINKGLMANALLKKIRRENTSATSTLTYHIGYFILRKKEA